MKLKLAAAALLLSSSAYAADLGGDCCADLDERVAELEATVAKKGNRRMSLEVSGHVNAALFTTDIDAGNLDRVRIIDNSNSQSRFRFKGEARSGQDWSAGFLMEFGVDGAEVSTRHRAVFLRLKQLGTIWLGHTSESTDKIMEVSLAPSDASTISTLAPFSSVIEDDTGLGLVNPFDGGRTGTLTFHSSDFAGFTASASWNEGEDWSAALRFAQDFGPIVFAAGIGYRKEAIFVGPADFEIGDRKFWGGSASIMHTATGLFLDGAYGNSDGWQTLEFMGTAFPIGDGELQLYATRGGLSKTISPLGRTTLYGEYGKLKIEDIDIEPSFFGIGVSQDIAGAAATIYGSWRVYDMDIEDVDDVNTFLAGVKVRF